VPEGIEGQVPYKGPLRDRDLPAGRRPQGGDGLPGCASIAAMREHASFVRITNAGLRESHVHDVIITKEAPNYRAE
jgi:IMP dehydrogenase